MDKRTCGWRWSTLAGICLAGAVGCGGGHGHVEIPPLPDAGPQGVDLLPPPGTPVEGWVDLHTHPLSNVGFAGKLIYGGVDAAPGGGALLPADPDCKADVRATSIAQALGHDESTHGGWGLDLDPADLLSGKFGVQNPCGDVIRQLVISAVQGVNDANDPPSDASGYQIGRASCRERG